jgi:hypothetical protein
MTRRRVAQVVWAFARWAWENRKTATIYELTVIRSGQEGEDYRRMSHRAHTQLALRGVHSQVVFEESTVIAPSPVDIDRAWSDLQKRDGTGGPS